MIQRLLHIRLSIADKKLKFLFVGGTIYRKGIDILLQAYVRTFNGLDNVSLIIKDMGGDSFYAGQTAKNQIDIIVKALVDLIRH